MENTSCFLLIRTTFSVILLGSILMGFLIMSTGLPLEKRDEGEFSFDH